MTYIINDFYWLAGLFTIEVKGVSDDGQYSENFILTFASPGTARDSFEVALAAAANARWGTMILASQVFGTKLIPNLQPTDDDGNPIIRICADTAVGLPNVVVQDIPDDCQAFRRSWLIACAPGEITIRDICVNNDLVGPTGVSYVVSSFFGCASEATIGSELQIDLIDRDNVLGYFDYYGLPLSKLEGLTSITGTFVAGEEIRSPTCRAKVLAVHDDYLNISFDRWDADGHVANFSDGETITGQTSGATAVLASPAFTEGAFIFLQRFIKDEALYGHKSHEERPGGARPLPPGLYFRCSIYNAGTETLYIDGAIGLGKK